MKIVLCGQLTNAFTARLNRHFAEEFWFPRDGGYYASLFRYTDPSYFDRAATLVTISDASVLPGLDWAVPDADKARDYGVIEASYEREEAREHIFQGAELLATALLDEAAFSQASLNVIERGGTERHSAQPNDQQRRSFAEQQLREIIFAVVEAGQPGTLLAITDD